MNYTFEFSENTYHTVRVVADSDEQAYEMALDKYNNGDYNEQEDITTNEQCAILCKSE